MNGKKAAGIILMIGYALFLGYSHLKGINVGLKMSANLYTFTKDLMLIVPCAFILIGLFEVWVKKETVEKHLGEGSSFMGYIWMILLAGTTVGGLYLAFPVAYSLYKKGAKLSIVFTYVGASSVCRIPMTIFEASFMGPKFTIIRLAVSLTLIIAFSFFLEKILIRENYAIEDGQNLIKKKK